MATDTTTTNNKVVDTSKVIEVYIDTKFGVDHNYVKDATQAEALEALTKKRTINRHDIRALEALGYEITLVMNPNLRLS